MENNCCHGYNKEEAGSFSNLNGRSRKDKVCLMWSVRRTGACTRFRGENAPTLTCARQSASRRADVTAQSRCLARPNNSFREASCHSASCSPPLKFPDLKDFTAETLPRNRRFGDKRPCLGTASLFFFFARQIRKHLFCGFVWSCNEESAAVVSDRASRWLHRCKSKFPFVFR